MWIPYSLTNKLLPLPGRQPGLWDYARFSFHSIAPFYRTNIDDISDTFFDMVNNTNQNKTHRGRTIAPSGVAGPHTRLLVE